MTRLLQSQRNYVTSAKLTLGAIIAVLCGLSVEAQDAPSVAVITPETAELHPFEGGRVVLNSSSDGTLPVNFVWFRNGYELPVVGPQLVLDPILRNDSGSYTVTATNEWGSATSDPVYTGPWVRTRPRIRRASGDTEITEGTPLELWADWEGTLPVTIEWWKNDQLIQSGQKSRLLIADPSPEDGGIYRVRVINPLGEAEQDVRVLPIPDSAKIAPIITWVADSIELTLGETITTQVSATGSLPMTFELTRDGGILASEVVTFSWFEEVGIGLPIDVRSIEGFGEYEIVVRNDRGIDRSGPVSVRRIPHSPPQLTPYGRPPSDMVVPRGGRVYWYVVLNGTNRISMTYQWFKDDEPIDGADSFAFVISNTSANDEGLYYCEIRNDAGRTRTAPARIEIEDPVPESGPPWFRSDRPADTVLIEGAPLNFWLSPEDIGGAPPTFYQWRRGNTVLAGENAASLRYPISSPEMAGDYFLRVENEWGSAEALVASIYILPPRPPVITNQTAPHLEFALGDQETLEAFAPGHPQPQYQWFKDGAPLPDETQSRLDFDEVEADSAGTYHLVATNAGGAVRSHDMVVSVIADPIPSDHFYRHPPVLQAREDDIFQDYSLSVLAPNSELQWFRDEEPLPEQTWAFLISQPNLDPGVYRLRVSKPDSVIWSRPHVLYRETDEPTSPFTFISGSINVISHESFNRWNPGLFQVRTRDVPIAAEWKHNGTPIAGQTDLTLWMTEDPLPAGAYTLEITTAAGVFTTPALELNYVLEDRPPYFTTQPRSIASTIDSSFLWTEVVSASRVGFQWFKNGEPITREESESFGLPNPSPEAAGEYFVRATNEVGSTDSAIAVVYFESPAPPEIIVQPRGISLTNPVDPDSPDSLESYVLSATPATYQWYFEGEPIDPNYNDRHLRFRGEAITVFGTYQLAVSNVSGTTWSEEVEVTFDPTPIGPEYFINPASVTLSPGADTSLKISTFNSPGPVQYEWFKDGALIAGATSAELNLNSLSRGDVGEYWVKVTSGAFSHTSLPARVEITNQFSPLRARHRIAGNGTTMGEPVTILSRLRYPEGLTSANYALLLPPGWSMTEQSAVGSDTAPTNGTEDLLEWHWTLPKGTETIFDFSLIPPTNQNGEEELAALLESTHELLEYQALAMPDPIVLAPTPNKHTADFNDSGQIELSELLRVIELYNTRHETSRTGRYQPAESSIDGFDPDASEPLATESRNHRIHLADTDWDGHLSLSELLRVIELYNYRSGTTRTGAYNRSPNTVDGFAPGEAE